MVATAQPQRFSYTWPAMGTPWRLIFYASDSAVAQAAIDSVRLRVEAIEQVSSDYRGDSEINRLVALPAGVRYAVSADLYALIYTSRGIARRSGGAFDPTVGPLTKLWRRAIRQQRFPDTEKVKRARTRVQYRWVQPRRRTVRLSRNGMQLDFGGIAKGYALDAAGAVLTRMGITAYLVDGGGDILLGRPPPGRDGWTITTPGGEQHLSQTAMAVSGSTYRYLEHGGRRYGHIVDPRTGLGVTHFATVTVCGPEATLADALASAVSVLGREEGRRLLGRYPAYRMSWREAVPSSP